MRRAVRRWPLLSGCWAGVAFVLAYFFASFVHSFDPCIWGGCSEDDRPLDREFALNMAEAFLTLWVPVAVAIAFLLALVSLGSAVAADFRSGRERRALEEHRPAE